MDFARYRRYRAPIKSGEPMGRVLLLLGVILAGCAAVRLIQKGEAAGSTDAANSAGKASVYVLDVRGELVILRVLNQGPAELTINRHNVLLRLPNGKLREPEAFAGDEKYVLQAGEDHQVNVRYRLGGLDGGDAVFIDIAEALWAGGKPLQSNPIQLLVGQD
jgi:hypothetical protein